VLASGIRCWHDEKQATYSAHLFEEETLTGRESLQTLDDFVGIVAFGSEKLVPNISSCVESSNTSISSLQTEATSLIS